MNTNGETRIRVKTIFEDSTIFKNTINLDNNSDYFRAIPVML